MPEAYLWEAAFRGDAMRVLVQEGRPGDGALAYLFIYLFLRSKLQWKCHEGCHGEGRAWGQS